MKRALIVGCGYTGIRLAARAAELDLEVTGTTRSEARAAEAGAFGIEPLVGELVGRGTLNRIAELAPHVVFYLVPPILDGPDPLLSVLELVTRPGLEAFVYASSTAVYGDRAGAWVDESDPLDPAPGVPEARRTAEEAVLGWGRERGTPTRICRITGIYGPGRTLRRSLESRSYVLIRGMDTWTNRIHVDDLVTGFIAAWQRGGNGRIYNLADDQPHRASEFAELAADLHGLPRPEWVDASEARRLAPERLRRKAESKRVRNRRLRDELGVGLAYPKYQAGLPAAVKAEKACA